MLSSEARDPSRGAVDHAEGTETLLRRLANHRTGQSEIDGAFGRQELARLRQILTSAGQARGRLVQPRRPSLRPDTVNA